MEAKAQQILQRLSLVEAEMVHPSVAGDRARMRALHQEYAYLTQFRQLWESILLLRKRLEESQQLMRSEKDPEFVSMIEEERAQLTQKLAETERQLDQLLVPPDPLDHCNTIIELRAGTGGDEAALFVADCVRMYQLLADRMGWRCEMLSAAPSDLGGFREYVMVVSGENVYRYLRHEAGTHRVQRVPETEAQGRVHTSAITIAVLPEPDEEEVKEISEKDLRVDTYRASGAGGQHVNTTDSAVRLTHLPTGLVVYCSEERSQHKNKAKAMRLLVARLAEAKRIKQEQELASTRALQVGSGDRSERIRTYNFPQNRVTDHRINLTLYNLDQVMKGQLEGVIEPLVAKWHEERKALENAQ